ncbi:helix-turn-helix domain-containing protein [Gloeobacter kilaueensis]|uniref:Transcriptional regulator n=1 Tax=Gloeobacter kilaueensis (strain ATCC BAA-2537 / CCAP 1431/1 / ULC 316 / JS1) TaxID=1183438 RepID=U5QME1_GLOK1|nr:helix-turn-helix transcriptional regulator [Gloeobacter kilaueensis]AGY60058.1 transcriptional regulator [Gloeobacter kilaueensis JS1]
MTVTNRLKDLLKQHGITVYRLSKMTGVPTNTLYRINNDGSVYPDKHVVDAICAALTCTPGDVLKYVPEKPGGDEN